MSSWQSCSKAYGTADQEGRKPSAFRWSGWKKHFAHAPHNESQMSRCSEDWADGQYSSFLKDNFTFHVGQQWYLLPEQFRTGQRAYLWKRYTVHAYFTRLLQSNLKSTPKNTDTYKCKVLFVLSSLWDLCSLDYIPPFIKPTFSDCTVKRHVCYCHMLASKLYLFNRYLTLCPMRLASTDNYGD